MAKAFKPAKLHYPATKPTVSLPEGTTQTFKKGTPVIFASGYITAAGTGPSVIFGISAEDAHNTAGDGLKNVLVYPIDSNDIWEFSWQATDDTFVITDYGTSYGLIIDPGSTGYWVVDQDAAGDQVIVIGEPFIANGALGDSERVYVKFDEANIQNS